MGGHFPSNYYFPVWKHQLGGTFFFARRRRFAAFPYPPIRGGNPHGGRYIPPLFNQMGGSHFSGFGFHNPSIFQTPPSGSQYSQWPGGNGNNLFGTGSQGFFPYPPQAMTNFPFLTTLNLTDLAKLTNDPIRHSRFWPSIPVKLPSDIPKFEGKTGEDPQHHIMTYHCWCSSNSLTDDSIVLRLFQRTLTGAAAKWYIELPTASFENYRILASAFLVHFQLPIRYDTGTELLTSL